MAIETSQRIGSVAIRAVNGIIHVEHLSTRERHGDDLAPAIERLFRRVELPPSALDAVAVSVGPGSFTGLRIAVTTAKMLAETIGSRVIAVPSALVVAENFDPTSAIELLAPPVQRPRRILVALASKQDSFWETRLERRDGRWEIFEEPRLVDSSSADFTDLEAIVADEHFPEAARAAAAGANVAVVPPRHDAATCLRVAEHLAAEGRFADPLTLLPLYPRQPEAVTIWEARQKERRASR